MVTTPITLLASTFIRQCILLSPVKRKSYCCLIKDLEDKGDSCRTWIYSVFVTWLRLWGYWSSFLLQCHIFSFFSNPLTVVFIRPKTFPKRKQRLQKWWFYALWTSLLQASFCCDANRNLKLANGLMGRMSSEVITLPDGQNLAHPFLSPYLIHTLF